MPETAEAAARRAILRCLEQAWPPSRPILLDAVQALEAGRPRRALALLAEASLAPSPAALMLARRDAKRALRKLLAAPTSVVCAWCRTVIRGGDGPASHGMCDDCLDRHYPPHLETEGERELRELEVMPEDAA